MLARLEWVGLGSGGLDTVLPPLTPSAAFFALQERFSALQTVAADRRAPAVYRVHCFSRTWSSLRSGVFCGRGGGLIIEWDVDGDAGATRDYWRRREACCAESLCCLFYGPGFNVDSGGSVYATLGDDGREDGHV